MIRSFYYNLSFRSKIIIMLLIIIIIPLTITSIMSYITSKNVIEQKVSYSAQQTFDTANERMDAVFRDIDEISKYLFQDDVILDIIKKENSEDTTVTDEEIRNLGSILANMMNTKRYISSIYIYTKNGRQFKSPQAIDLNINDFSASQYYERVIASKGGFTWLGMEENRYGKLVIVVGRQLNDPVNLEEIGVLAIALDHESFIKTFDDIDLGDNSTLYIIDSNGEVLFHNNRKKIRTNISEVSYIQTIIENESGSFVCEVDENESLVVFNTSKETGLKLVGVMPLTDLTAEINNIGLVTLIVGLASLILAILTTIYLTGSMTRPLRELVRLMDKVKDEDLSVRFNSKYNDEISEAGNNFNLMIERIQTLIETIKEEQYRIKSAELRALQAQINPHFLYNTLTSIYWSSRKAGAEDSAKMASALSNYFRLGLNKGLDITNIQKELTHAKNYLIIQQYRYKDKFDYEMDIDENILNCKIVKLVLQPLIENAIIHGIEPMAKKSLIIIRGRKKNNKIFLSVIDNGTGFKQESAVENRSDDKGYGLGNVIDRIKLYFGEDYGIYITSTEGEGTTAEIKIPYICDRGNVDV